LVSDELDEVEVDQIQRRLKYLEPSMVSSLVQMSTTDIKEKIYTFIPTQGSRTVHSECLFTKGVVTRCVLLFGPMV